MTISTPPAWNQIRSNATTFAARWADEKFENAGAQAFGTEFLGIFDVDQDFENLPAPEKIAAEIIEELQSALNEFAAIAEALGVPSD
jgi:hypothetical protein